MARVSDQVKSADEAICRNIESLCDQRALLSQNVLSHLRNLVEGVAVWLHTGSSDSQFEYAEIDRALSFVRSKARFNFLGRFHKLLQKSASHYALDGDASERLMLKYYEYLHRIRTLLQEECGAPVLQNLEAFPIDLEPSLREYHEKIAERIRAGRSVRTDRSIRGRYYIHKTRPFFVGKRIYYEVTFYRAINKVSKFDRVIGFTDIEMTDKYAAMLTLQRDSINVLGHTMPITVVREWGVSIRPCELNNFARLLGMSVDVQSNSKEYRYLMHGLTAGFGSLLDLIDMADEEYARVREAGTVGLKRAIIFPMLDEARRIIRTSAPAHNVLRYLMLRMHNRILKTQHSPDSCGPLSSMRLKYGCIPFDTMPFCTSLPGHNPRFWDLVAALELIHRDYELLARYVKNNVERRGMLYTPVADVAKFGVIDELISSYNTRINYKHMSRKLMVDKNHVFIREYEDDAVDIIKLLRDYASSGVDGYSQAVERWLDEAPRGIDDPVKKVALKRLFSGSRVALIYGAAGTGKSTMVDHIANYFNDKEKLFLAHTHPAIDNLKRRVTAQNSDFRTIRSQISRSAGSSQYDLLVIDECSTVSNADLIRVLNKTSSRLVVLVGDVYQIESIQFGNWFGLIRSFIPKTSVFELTTPFRTKDRSLLSFWKKVRNLDSDIAETMVRDGYTTILDKSLFEAQGRDEIILCLNYDGLYGINNINRFLQSNNPGAATTWGESTYKIGDPVLFYETERFRPVIYNNLKGWIVGIEQVPGRIRFDVELDRSLSEFDVVGSDLEWLGESIVRFNVYEYDSDEDDDALNTAVPFQVAYAVSIHKAQGLEYDSVKVVITDANEDDITHSIFYTAVTRARERLRIFWTPETQQGVLKRLSRNTNPKDVAILSSRRAVTPIRG